MQTLSFFPPPSGRNREDNHVRKIKRMPYTSVERFQVTSKIVKSAFGTGSFDPFLRQVSGGKRNRGTETMKEKDSKRGDMNLALVFGERFLS